MSFKSFIQIVIILLIPIIIAGVYLKYFDEKKSVVEEIKLIEGTENKKLLDLEKKILELELKNNNLSKKLQTKINEISNVEDSNILKSEAILELDHDDYDFEAGFQSFEDLYWKSINYLNKLQK